MYMTKRRLGLDYLTATGALFTAIVLVNAVIAFETSAIQTVGILIGVVPSVSLVSARYLLERTTLNDEQIWAIATWGGLGIGAFTLVNTGIIFLYRLGDPVFELGLTILASNVAIGGVVGILIGGFWEHGEENRRLNEKNAVLSRVLRHDLRNAAGVIGAHAEILKEDLPAAECHRVDVIAHKTRELAELGDLARTLQTAVDPHRERPKEINVANVVARRCEVLGEQHEDIRIVTDLADEAWAYADGLLDAAVDNLLENAIVHNDSIHPEIHVRVGVNARWVSVEIADNGPGIPAGEITALETVDEPLEHSSGTGLWLVKWLVDRYGGHLDIDQTGPGTNVHVKLRRATPVTSDGSIGLTSIYS